ncbi:MAG TPA: efflux RND transporter periplasmic adaptor subunit [Steroidobacteraceae bacterium]|nr:efflux RND transporter periplasmic adaptor subunit [Steroidobacteraceae bacterium]
MPVDEDALNSLRIERATPVPARPGPRRMAALVVAGLALAGGVAFWLMRGTHAVEVETTIAQAVSGSGAAAVLDASGYVVARRLATVSSKVTGKIVEVKVEEGMVVKEGQVLARLDDSLNRAQFEVATRQLEAARNDYGEVEVRLADAKRTMERRRTLRAQNLVSQTELDAAEAEAGALTARLAALNSQIEVAAGNVKLAQVGLDDLLVRAPFAGVVTSKDAQPGEMISPVSAGGGFTRTGIATVVDMDSREIEVDVNESFINRVSSGQRTEARLDAYPDWAIASHVINIVPTADRDKATVRVRLAFDQLDPRILPDMGVKVHFLDAAPVDPAAAKPVARLTNSAIAHDGEQSIVWVINRGRVERRAVRLGAARGDSIDVLAGIRAGEVVVVNPPTALRDGATIRSKEKS